MTNDEIEAPDERPARAKRNKAATAADAKAMGTSKQVWMGTAVGIGSTALVAALLYAKRRK